MRALSPWTGHIDCNRNAALRAVSLMLSNVYLKNEIIQTQETVSFSMFLAAESRGLSEGTWDSKLL